MRIEASALKIADVVRVPGQGDAEIVRCEEVGPDILVWFRGDEEKDEPSMVLDFANAVEVARAREHRPATPTLRVVEPEPTQPTPTEPRGPGRPADRKRQADTLRELADRVSVNATHDADEVIADAMLLAADQVERSELTYLARLTSRPQIDDLEAALGVARREREQQSNERIEGGPELADVPFVRLTGVVACKEDLHELLAHAGERVDAGKRERMQLLAAGDDRRVELLGKDVDLVRAFLVRDGKAKRPAQIEGIARQLKRHDRLGRLGIRDTASLRAALREYLGCFPVRSDRPARQIDESLTDTQTVVTSAVMVVVASEPEPESVGKSLVVRPGRSALTRRSGLRLRRRSRVPATRAMPATLTTAAPSRCLPSNACALDVLRRARAPCSRDDGPSLGCDGVRAAS
jgi:hypothetical protein